MSITFCLSFLEFIKFLGCVHYYYICLFLYIISFYSSYYYWCLMGLWVYVLFLHFFLFSSLGQIISIDLYSSFWFHALPDEIYCWGSLVNYFISVFLIFKLRIFTWLYFLKNNLHLFIQFSSVTQSCPTLCDPVNHSTPGLPVHHQLPEWHPNPCPLSWWCHWTISSSVVPFSSCPQSFPALGPFQMSQLFASGGPSIGVSVSASVIPMNNILYQYEFV